MNYKHMTDKALIRLARCRKGKTPTQDALGAQRELALRENARERFKERGPVTPEAKWADHVISGKPIPPFHLIVTKEFAAELDKALEHISNVTHEKKKYWSQKLMAKWRAEGKEPVIGYEDATGSFYPFEVKK